MTFHDAIDFFEQSIPAGAFWTLQAQYTRGSSGPPQLEFCLHLGGALYDAQTVEAVIAQYQAEAPAPARGRSAGVRG